MKKSALQQARAAYKPQLPIVLTGGVKVVEGEATQSADNQEDIKNLFPNTYGLPEIRFEKVPAEESVEPINVGVILSGGQAPADTTSSAVSSTVSRTSIKRAVSTVSSWAPAVSLTTNIKNSLPKSLTNTATPAASTSSVQAVQNSKTKEQFDKGLEILKELDIKALVIIGGDDSNTNAAILAEYYKAIGAGVQVIGVPKTIDGDLKNNVIETSFGFDTATKVYSEVIGNIQRDCNSAKNTGTSSNSWAVRLLTSPSNALSSASPTSASSLRKSRQRI